MANCVFVTISRSTARLISAPSPLARSGRVGKSSFGSVCIRDSKRSAATFTAPFFSSSMRMSVSGSSFTISKNFFAGSVSAPGFAIDAGQVPRRPTSRSVAARRIWSPFASSSTLARIGIVFLRSTMPWNSASSLRRSVFRTTSSMVFRP